MNLQEWLKQTGITHKELSHLVTRDDPARSATTAAIQQWNNSKVPADRLWQLERLSLGALTAVEMRPDIVLSPAEYQQYLKNQGEKECTTIAST